MSFEEKQDPGLDEMLNSKTSQLDADNLALETRLCFQANEMLQNESCGNQNQCSSQSVLQGAYSSPSEMEEINDRSDNSQVETGEELNINNKLTMLQNVFKTVGGDLEDIKTLMLRLRGILSNGCDRENQLGVNKLKQSSSGESSKEVIVIDDSDDDDDDEPMQDSLRLHHETNQDDGPSRESSTDSCFDDSKYSTLVTDIEVLKEKLVSLKRNLAE